MHLPSLSNTVTLQKMHMTTIRSINDFPITSLIFNEEKSFAEQISHQAENIFWNYKILVYLEFHLVRPDILVTKSF